MVSTEHIWTELGKIRDTQSDHGWTLKKLSEQHDQMIELISESKTSSPETKSSESSIGQFVKLAQWIGISLLIIYAMRGGDTGKILGLLSGTSG